MRLDHTAVAAIADPPAIAVGLSSMPEDRDRSNTSASATAETKAMGASTIQRPTTCRWTEYPPETRRKSRDHCKRIVTLVGAAPPHAPKPTRPVPVGIFGAHAIHPSQEVDWTLHPDKAEERNLRDMRNRFIKEMLTRGRSCQFRSSGNSLWPKVHSNDVTMWEPVTDHSKLMIGHIVFCEVQPEYGHGPRFYGHMIHEICTWHDGSTYWKIGNNNKPPHINGWCTAEHIYGVLMEVVGDETAA